MRQVGRLREHVLTGLGWRIRRVWSTDWWFDPERAADRLHDMLLADLDAARAAPPEPVSAAEFEPDKLANADLFSEDLVGETEATQLGRLAEAPGGDDEIASARGPASAAAHPDTMPLPQDVAPRRMYAEAAPMPAASSAVAPPEATEAVYRIADLQAASFTPDGARFYEPPYRIELRRMVDGHDDEAVVLMMARFLGLGRLRGSTRLRLEEAVRLKSIG